MFLTCYKKRCNFFMWIDQAISHGIKEQLSYSPQPQVARFHPYEEVKEMLRNDTKKLNKKHLFNTSVIHAKMMNGLMCDNGFNSLGSPNIFHGLRYREWMREVWESYKFYVQTMKEDSSDDPHPTLSLEKDDVLRQPYYNYAREDRHHPGSYRVLKTLYERHIEGKHVPFQLYVITPEEHEVIENKENYRLISLKLLYKMHADQNASTCFAI